MNISKDKMMPSSARSARSDLGSARSDHTGGSRKSIMKILKSGRHTDRTTGRSTGATTIERLRPILTKKAQRLACVEFATLLIFMVGFIFLVWLHEVLEFLITGWAAAVCSFLFCPQLQYNIFMFCCC